MPRALTLDELLRMRGKPVRDEAGDEFGSIEDVYYDRLTRLPEWLGVSPSFWGFTRVLVPIKDATLEEEYVQVPFRQEQVKDTPSIRDREIDEETERQLYAYYGIPYSREAAPSGLPEGMGTSLTEASGADREWGHLCIRWLWPDEPDATPAPKTQSAATESKRNEAGVVLSDKPEDVPGTFHDTSKRPDARHEQEDQHRMRRKVMRAAAVAAIVAGGVLATRMLRGRRHTHQHRHPARDKHGKR